MSIETRQEIIKALSSIRENLVQEAFDAALGTFILNPNPNPPSDPKQNLIQKVLNLVEMRGLREFYITLNRKQLHSIKSLAKQKLGPEEVNQKSLKVESVIKNWGIDNFLHLCPEPLLVTFSENLGLTCFDGQKVLQDHIADEVLLLGMKSFLHKLSFPLLIELARDLKISRVNVDVKALLVDSIMVEIFELEPLSAEMYINSINNINTDPSLKKILEQLKTSGQSNGVKKEEEEDKREEEEEEEEDATKKRKLPRIKTSDNVSTVVPNSISSSSSSRGQARPPTSTIKLGMTYVDLYDTFNATDLREYCREQGLPHGSKFTKPHLIKSILKFLESGVISEKKRKIKRKSSSKPKRSKNNTKSTKKSRPKSVDDDDDDPSTESPETVRSKSDSDQESSAFGERISI